MNIFAGYVEVRSLSALESPFQDTVPCFKINYMEVYTRTNIETGDSFRT